MSHQPAELEEALHDVVRLATDHLPEVDAASIVLWDSSSERFSVSASTVPDQPAEASAERVRASGGATRWIVDNKKACAVAEIGNDPFGANPLLEENGYRAYAGQPILVNGHAVGVLYALHGEPHRYSKEEHAVFGQLASWASLAVAEAQRGELAREQARQLRARNRDSLTKINELRRNVSQMNALHGLIRICASCKDIRNSEGEWERVEDYLSERSLAEFSHGLCPDCSQHVYPDPAAEPTDA